MCMFPETSLKSYLFIFWTLGISLYETDYIQNSIPNYDFAGKFVSVNIKSSQWFKCVQLD